MVARRSAHPPPTKDAARRASAAASARAGTVQVPPRPATPLLPILALMNGSALLALTLLVVWPAEFDLTQQVVALLAMWLLVNLLAVVLVRLIDSGRSGAASVNVSKEQATLRVSVARDQRTAPERK